MSSPTSSAAMTKAGPSSPSATVLSSPDDVYVLPTKSLSQPSHVSVSPAATDFRSRLVALHRWLPSIAGSALSIYSLVTGISHLRDNAYCQHPLAPWLVVAAVLGLTQFAVMFARTLASRGVKSTAFRALLLASLLFFLVMIAWTILGAAWVFRISSSTCDSGLYSSAKSVVIVNIVICAVVTASIAYRVRQKLTMAQKHTADEQQHPLNEMPL